MSRDELVRLLSDWIEIPSVTGEEGDYGAAVERALGAAGFDCERQEVAPGRFNVLARAGRPEVVFCTHLDTVPPFFGVSRDSEFVYGRGSCDAKGQAVAMLAAGQALLARGEERIGFLFTVGEEVDSVGAALADAELAEPWAPRWVLIGEPTDGRFVRAHKGIFKAGLCAHGQAGHSSQDVGPSAVHELVHACERLLASGWGEDAVLGRGTPNLGRIEGGVAANVVAASARAELLVRTVEEPEVVQARVESCLGPHVTLEGTFKSYGPVHFHVPEGEEAGVVAFGTDAPHMRRWGTPLLQGCGSILDAHTDHEKLSVRELEACVERHVRTVEGLLARA